MAFHRKYEHLLALQPDIAVIPECAKIDLRQRARAIRRENRRLRGLSAALSISAGGSPRRTDGRSLRREARRRDDRQNEPDLRRTSAGLCRNGARSRGGRAVIQSVSKFNDLHRNSLLDGTGNLLER